MAGPPVRVQRSLRPLSPRRRDNRPTHLSAPLTCELFMLIRPTSDPTRCFKNQKYRGCVLWATAVIPIKLQRRAAGCGKVSKISNTNFVDGIYDHK